MRGSHHFAAECCADGLVSQADAENRYFAGKVANEINADASFLRRARARRNDDPLRPQRFDVVNRYRVVALNLDLCAQFAQILDKVVSERIVVVEYEDHCCLLLSEYHPEKQRLFR